MKRARLLIADDHSLTLEGIRSVLQSRYEVVAAVGDGRSLVQEAIRLKPDLIITDITMPLLNGIDAAIQLKKPLRGTKLLFMTMHVNGAYLQAALQAGATGFVVKTAPREQLLEAVETVLGGGIYVTPEVAHRQLEPLEQLAKGAATLQLTERERETLQLIAEGKTSKEIAATLGVSIRTATFHRENLKKKLGLRTTSELTKHAIQLGLV